MIITRADAIEVVHKYFVEALDKEPHEIDEDGYDVFTDMKSVNALLHHNKMISKALKALPSADRPSGEWIYKTNDESVCEEWECSNCGNWNFVKTDFCPNCGARMKGADHEID